MGNLHCIGQSDTFSSVPKDLFDGVFVDGSHTEEAAYRDLRHLNAMSRHKVPSARILFLNAQILPQSLVVADDCDDPEVYRAWLRAEKEGLLRSLRKGICWESMCIGEWLREGAL